MEILTQFLHSFLKDLNKNDVPYIIERNYEHLPQWASNDVDFLMSQKSEEEFVSAALRTVNNLNLKIVLITSAYGGGRLYLYSSLSSSNSEIVRIDYLTRLHYRGIPLISSYVILGARRKRGMFYIPAEGAEAALSLIVPLMYTGTVKEKYKNSIAKGVSQDRKNFINCLIPYLPVETIDFLVNSVLSRNFSILETKRKELMRTYLCRNKIESATGFIKYITNYSRRLRKYPGMMICFVGPDGSGKSTTIDKLPVAIKTLYPEGRLKKLHWRPEILPQLRVFTTEPDLRATALKRTTLNPNKRGISLSFLRWLYYSADFILGYYLKLLPMMIRSTAIIMDRYYYDTIVDPIRYGFNLPQWLFKSILPFIPKPDLTIYLDNSAEALYHRKQELPVAELNRQVEAWREFIPKLPNPTIVTTDKTLSDVVNEVTKTILTTRSAMTRKALKTDPEESFYLWKSDIVKNYVYVPSKINCRWIVPTNPILAKRAWDLYLPYSLTGRIFKNIVKLSSGSDFLEILFPQLLFPQFQDNSQKIRHCIENVFGRKNLSLALSTGSPGPFRKLTALVISPDGDILGYLKIARTPSAIERITHEARILRKLWMHYQKVDGRIRIPTCLYESHLDGEHLIILSPPPFKGKSGRAGFDDQYAEVLAALMQIGFYKKKFTDSLFYKNLKRQVNNYPLPFNEIVQSGFDILKKNVGNRKGVFSLSHGDFVPWNILWHNNEAYVFDWESACYDSPIGIDLMHFLFQTAFLLKKLRGSKLLFYILRNSNKAYEMLSSRSKMGFLGKKSLLLSYLLHMATVEDKDQQFSRAAVERRNLIKIVVS